jgi:hypothetical protein
VQIVWEENVGALGDDSVADRFPNDVLIISTTVISCRSVVLSDFNGDGFTDAAWPLFVETPIKEFSTMNWVPGLSQDRDTVFMAPSAVTDRAIGALPTVKGDELATGDIDGDGTVDVLSLDASTGVVTWLRGGVSTTAYTVYTPPDIASLVSELALSDVDGDGDVDALLVQPGIGTLLMVRNNRSETFLAGAAVSAATLLVATPEASTALALPVTALVSLRVANLTSPSAGGLTAVLIGLNGVQWSVVAITTSPSSVRTLLTLPAGDAVSSAVVTIVVADVNADGLPDLLVSVSSPPSTTWYLNTAPTVASPATFSAANIIRVSTSLAAGQRRGLVAADVSGDGVVDVVLIPAGGGSVVWFQAARASESTPGTPLLIASTNNVFAAVEVVDGDSDGQLDVFVVEDSVRPVILWFRCVLL